MLVNHWVLEWMAGRWGGGQGLRRRSPNHPCLETMSSREQACPCSSGRGESGRGGQCRIARLLLGRRGDQGEQQVEEPLFGVAEWLGERAWPWGSQ